MPDVAEGRETLRHLAEAEKLRDAEMALARRRLAIDQDIAAAKQRAAGALLDAAVAGEQPAAGADEVVHLVAEADALETAILEARERRTTTIGAYWAARAKDHKRDARKAHAEADKIAERSGKLLAELAKIEGVEYEPGQVYDRVTGMPMSLRPDPASVTARRRAQALDAEARRLDTDPPKPAGVTLAAADVDGLLAQLADADPLKFGPTIAELLAWHAKIAVDVEAAQLADREAGATSALTLTVHYRPGGIIGSASGWQLERQTHEARAETFDGLLAKLEAAGSPVTWSRDRDQLAARWRSIEGRMRHENVGVKVIRLQWDTKPIEGAFDLVRPEVPAGV